MGFGGSPMRGQLQDSQQAMNADRCNPKISPLGSIESDLVIGPIAAVEAVQSHPATCGGGVHKTAISYVNTGMGAFIAFAEDDQVARPNLLGGQGRTPAFEFGHGARGIEFCIFLVDMRNQSAAVKT